MQTLCFIREMKVFITFCKSRFRPRWSLEGAAAWNANLFRDCESEEYESGVEAPSYSET